MSPAYVLHRRAYSDNSLLVDFFTLNHGRLSCVARGAKTGKRKKAAILQPFIPLIISFSGRGEVKTLRECEATAPALAFTGNTIYAAYYLNELVMKFLERFDINEAAFIYYANALSELQQEPNAEVALRRFELALLGAIGFELELEYTADGHGRIDALKHYCYEIEQGPQELTGGHCRGAMVSGQTLINLHNGVFHNETTLREAKRLMRHVIGYHLDGYHFKSREFFSITRTNRTTNGSEI